jgi:hypothetical protein
VAAIVNKPANATSSAVLKYRDSIVLSPTGSQVVSIKYTSTAAAKASPSMK